MLNGQKVWTTWAHLSDFAICLARTDPTVPKRRGPHVLRRRPARAGRRGAAAAPHRRRGRLQRGVPRRRARPRLVPGRRGRRRLARSRAPRSPASGRWCRARGRAASTASAARASTAVIAAGRRARARPRTRTCARSSWQLYSEERIRDWTNQRVRSAVRAGRHAGAGGLDRQGAPGQPEPAAAATRRRPARAGRDRVGRARTRDLEAWADVDAVREPGDAAQPGEHDRGRHHRGEQEHPRRAGARPPPRARPVPSTSPWEEVPRS